MDIKRICCLLAALVCCFLLASCGTKQKDKAESVGYSSYVGGQLCVNGNYVNLEKTIKENIFEIDSEALNNYTLEYYSPWTTYGKYIYQVVGKSNRDGQFYKTAFIQIDGETQEVKKLIPQGIFYTFEALIDDYFFFSCIEEKGRTYYALETVSGRIKEVEDIPSVSFDNSLYKYVKENNVITLSFLTYDFENNEFLIEREYRLQAPSSFYSVQVYDDCVILGGYFYSFETEEYTYLPSYYRGLQGRVVRKDKMVITDSENIISGKFVAEYFLLKNCQFKSIEFLPYKYDVNKKYFAYIKDNKEISVYKEQSSQLKKYDVQALIEKNKNFEYYEKDEKFDFFDLKLTDSYMTISVKKYNNKKDKFYHYGIFVMDLTTEKINYVGDFLLSSAKVYYPVSVKI